MALGVVLRVAYLWQPMRYDESVTYMYFARLAWNDAVATYTYPNNHVLHTLLVKASSIFFGPSPAALRLPALLAGVAGIPVTYVAMRLLYGGRAALFAAAVSATAGSLILYSTNARGYSMVVLAFLLLVIVGARIVEGATASDWLALALLGALGTWTIPTMLYPFGAVVLWIGLSLLADGRSRRRDVRRLGAAVVISALLTLALYSPILQREGVAALTRNKFVASSGWFEFFSQLPATLGDAVASWSLGISPIVSLLLALCAVVALARHASLSRFRVGLPLAVFVWCAWLLAVNHRAPFARVWIWMLPLVAALAGAGVLHLTAGRKRLGRLVEQRFTMLIVAFALAAATSVVVSRAVLLSLETGTFRDAPQAAAILARTLGRGDRVLTAIPTNAPLAYYLDQLGVADNMLTNDERGAAHIVAVVNQAEGQTLDDVAGRSIVHDSTHFSDPRLLAQLPASALVIFDRRDASKH